MVNVLHTVDVENPPFVDSFPRETMDFSHLSKCLPQGIYIGQFVLELYNHQHDLWLLDDCRSIYNSLHSY